jgi:hypothetical protein
VETNYFNRSGGVCGNGTERRMLPEAELWTQVILQAIDDLDGRSSSIPGSAQDSAREWFASESDAVGSFIWTCQIINVDPSFIRSRIAKKYRINDKVKLSIAEGAELLRGKASHSEDDFDQAQACGCFEKLAVQL